MSGLSNTLLTEILESIQAPFYTVDSQWQFIYVNSAACQAWNRNPDELLGKQLWQEFPQAVGSQPYLRILQSMQERQPAHFESFSPILKRWLDIYTSPLANGGLAVYFHDIHDRKQAEEALRDSQYRLEESQGQFRHLADAVPQLVWTAGPDGSVDYYNRRYREYNGIAPGEGGVWEWGPVLHPEDRMGTVNAWTNAVNTGTTYQAEHRVQMADGSYRWHLSRGYPAYDAQGNVVRWYGTATDIHEQKLAQAALEETAEKLARSNRELEQFAFIASHDLQEPLRKIKMFSASLAKQLGAQIPEQAADTLQRIQSSVNRMQAMINGLLNLSRVSTAAGDFLPTPLQPVIEEAISNLETAISRHNGRVKINEPLPIIEADPIQMQNLFQNLIANALKFHRPGVPPEVQISAERLAYPLPPGVAVHVQDNGIGLDLIYVERIFQPFQRLHGRSEFEGTGLGLAICAKIIERHHGRIEVTSTPGKGSRFSVILPLRQQG